MEAATYLCAAASAGGRVELQNCIPAHLEAVTGILQKAGCEIARGKDFITICADGLTSPGLIETGPYPAFPTDAQAPMMAALLKANGECRIRETVFSQRMHHIPALQAMGGNLVFRDGQAVITGTRQLFGARVTATDLRGGAALVVAALGASGETQISGLGHLFRGYEDIAGKLSALGAQMTLG
jgi:UDP-N-acetylglucosamine 1-carboxyvinyltransferase